MIKNPDKMSERELRNEVKELRDLKLEVSETTDRIRRIVVDLEQSESSDAISSIASALRSEFLT